MSIEAMSATKRRIVIDPRAPLDVARAFLSHTRQWDHERISAALSTKDLDFGYGRPAELRQHLRVSIYLFLADAWVQDFDQLLPCKPNRQRVNEVLDALPAALRMAKKGSK